jgi:hypothetical protein
MSYKIQKIETLTLAGASGTQTSTLRVTGAVYGVYVKFTGQTSPVFTLTTQGTVKAPTLTLIGFTGNTSAWYWPRAKLVDNTNTAITNSFDYFVIDDLLVLGVSSGGAAGTIDCWVVWDDSFKTIG